MTGFPKVLLLYLQPVTHPKLNIHMLVWFNSPSISNLLHIPKRTIEIGCNHLYLERQLDYCCAYDPRTRDSITMELAKNTKNTKYTLPTFYTRNSANTELFKQVVTPNRLKPQDSGTLAVALAVFYLKAKTVNIIGCGWNNNESKSIFEDRYHHRDHTKGSNSKIQLLRTYASEYGVKINFISDRPVDTNLGWFSVEEYLDGNL